MSRNTPVAGEAASAANYMNDEHWGKGGRYILNPTTKQRTPVVEAPADGVTETAVDGDTPTADAPTTDTLISSTAKGKRHG
ncbi:MAG: hypothetical protein KBD39_11110 [Sterolibacterium sp.]|jgi:hypothetical protein|nr:hypothetical protein [Sterolibacterium sp.]